MKTKHFLVPAILGLTLTLASCSKDALYEQPALDAITQTDIENTRSANSPEPIPAHPLSKDVLYGKPSPATVENTRAPGQEPFATGNAEKERTAEPDNEIRLTKAWGKLPVKQ